MTVPYESDSAQQHRRQSASSVRCAVITSSDTRSLADDRGGDLLGEMLQVAGHLVVARQVVPDDLRQLAALTEKYCDDVDAVFVTGGTGVAARDQTPEAIEPLFDKRLPGFGELFRMLSYQEIGAAAMLSRASAGVRNRTVVALLPGSPAAVRLAMDKLVAPELAHLVQQARK
ncbi:MAG: molybdenum cofactor biosynthesis protein B [Planctomycetota bacterium]